MQTQKNKMERDKEGSSHILCGLMMICFFVIGMAFGSFVGVSMSLQNSEIANCK